MKLERLFEVKNNVLYKLGEATPIDTAAMAKPVSWSAVEPQSDVYDEAFLAALREELKALEEQQKYVFIEPCCDKGDCIALAEPFIAAMKHCARRIKDCVAVAGFAIPPSFTEKGFGAATVTADFIEALSQKHAHYVYFCKRSAIGEQSCPSDIVLY